MCCDIICCTTVANLIANNFVAGIILLIERSIKVGDRVEVGELNGDVIHIGPRATYIRTNDNINVIVPNAEFTEKRVINWTAEDRQIRFSIPVGVSYGSNPEQVRDILLRVASEHPDVLQNPKPDVIFIGFGESSLDFELRVWTIRRVQTPQILKSELYFPIFRAFGENGIELLYQNFRHPNNCLLFYILCLRPVYRRRKGIERHLWHSTNLGDDIGRRDNFILHNNGRIFGGGLDRLFPIHLNDIHSGVPANSRSD